MLNQYFKNLYQRTMHEAYTLARKEIASSLQEGGKCLDCGAHNGYEYEMQQEMAGLERERYHGIEWNQAKVLEAREKSLNVVQGDLNREIQLPDREFRCVFGLSVLEHLLNPCRFLRECYRVLEDGGSLVILTPNISTYFTAVLILLGKMPSSGPHPDSDLLIKQEEVFKVSHESLRTDSETDTPAHRHLVVFSYRVLLSYIRMLGFSDVRGFGFGLYPFPGFMQPVLEKIDPYHCHQMVIVARK